jgi:hypothetical protein
LFLNQTDAWNDPIDVGDVTGDTTANSASLFAAAWDPLNERWLLAAALTTHDDTNIYASYDGTDEWVQLAATDFNFFAVTSAAATGMAVAQSGTDDTTTYVATICPTQLYLQAWTAGSYSPTTAGGFTVGGGLQDVQLLAFGSYMIMTFARASSPGQLSFSNDGFATVTTVAPTGTPNVNYWILKSNGSQVIAAPRRTALATPFVFTSLDGHTWTTQTSSLGFVLTSTDQITGLDWGADAIGEAWFMTVLTTTPSTKILRSPDGINWSLVTTLANGFLGSSLCAVGANTLYSVQNPDVQEAYRIVVAPYGGGLWYGTPAVVPPVPAGGSQKPVLVGSPNQALAFSATHVRSSVSRSFLAAIT